MAGSLYYPPGARNKTQYDQMVDLELRGVCLLCPEHIHRERENSVRYETPHWIVTQSDHPYRGTKHHLLLLPKVHVRRLTELSKTAWAELQEILQWIDDNYGIPDYGFCSRNGRMEYTAATIAHLHLHVAVADTESEDPIPVVFHVSSRPRQIPRFVTEANSPSPA